MTTSIPEEERTRRDTRDAVNPQQRDAGEKPRDKPVEEEADKDIKQNAEDIKNGG